MGIRNLPDILISHELTLPDYETIKLNPFFMRLLDASMMEWQSVRNTAERTAIEAAALFEQAMPIIYARMTNNKEQLNHVVEAAKLMAKAGGIGEGNSKNTQGEKFSITINLGADTKLEFNPNKTPNAPIIDVTPDPPSYDEERV